MILDRRVCVHCTAQLISDALLFAVASTSVVGSPVGLSLLLPIFPLVYPPPHALSSFVDSYLEAGGDSNNRPTRGDVGMEGDGREVRGVAKLPDSDMSVPSGDDEL